jgi:hypothetical protein
MQPKPGYKTTEFLATLVLQIILLLNTINVWNYVNPKYTVIIQGVLGAAYAFSRGLAKVAAPPPLDGATSLYPTEPPQDGTTEPPK